MKARAGLFAAALILTAARAQDTSADYKLGSLQISQPWSRATPKGATVAGAYLKITNNGTTPDRLVSGSSPVAGRFEVHEVTTDNGVMKMRRSRVASRSSRDKASSSSPAPITSCCLT